MTTEDYTTTDRQMAAVMAGRRSPGRMMVVCSNGRLTYNRHTALMDDAIVETLAQPEGRLILSVTVRAGKSVLTSRYGSAWYLGRNPNHRVCVACHAQELASEHGAYARDLLERWGPSMFQITVNPASRSRSRWDILDHEGGLVALGVGGSPIGKGFEATFVDDPIKSYEVAMNPEQRRKINEVWWQGTMESRIMESGSVIVICSRWHEDDLSGWLKVNYPGEWRELHIPALCVDPDTDLLDRDVGESYWPTAWPTHSLEMRRDRVGQVVWQAQYQQDPITPGGRIFPVDNLRPVDRTAVDWSKLRWCRGWDLASTSGGGDWTAGVLIGHYPNGRWLIADVRRVQENEDGVRQLMRQTADADGPATWVRFPQDPGQAGKGQAEQLVRMMAGFNVASKPVTGDKEVRAAGLAAQVQAGNVDYLAGEPWVIPLIDELRTFPAGRHDDQVDAAAEAFNALALTEAAGSGIARGAWGRG